VLARGGIKKRDVTQKKRAPEGALFDDATTA
jgi:hypothetical protein